MNVCAGSRVAEATLHRLMCSNGNFGCDARQQRRLAWASIQVGSANAVALCHSGLDVECHVDVHAAPHGLLVHSRLCSM